MRSEPNERWVPLGPESLSPDPFEAFEAWFAEATPLMREPEAICIATADAAGQPRARMVLLRGRDATGFSFFTNYDSRKGHDLAENPRASILWYAEPLGRQIRIEGVVEQLSPTESDAYFAGRPKGHQVGAHASEQSQPIESRAALEARLGELEASFGEGEVPRPPHWGGYRLVPTHFEFWQHRTDRLHDRVVYEPDGAGGWSRVRLQP
jgi:pyridoxamine 5'-phosphate oxidase